MREHRAQGTGRRIVAGHRRARVRYTQRVGRADSACLQGAVFAIEHATMARVREGQERRLDEERCEAHDNARNGEV